MRNIYKIFIYLSLSFFSIITTNSVHGQSKARSFTVSIFYGSSLATDVNVCQGTPIGLTAIVTGGLGYGREYTWTHNILSGQFFEDGETLNIRSNAVPDTYELTVNVKDSSGTEVYTCSASAVVVIKPVPRPEIHVSGAIPFCEGGSVEFNEIATSGSLLYQWQLGISDIEGATSNSYIAETAGRYRVIVKGENGCSGISTPIVVTVNPLPNATVSNNGPLCDGDDIQLTSGPGGADSYSWTSNAVTPFASSLQNPTMSDVNHNNSGTYSVTVTDNNGCSKTVSTVVEVSQEVEAGVIGSNQTICYGTTPNGLTNVTSPSGGRGDFTYSWQQKVGAGAWTDIAGATGATYAPPALTQTTQYKRIATNTCGSEETAPVTIMVLGELNAGTIGSNQSICYNTAPATFTSVNSASGGDMAAWMYVWEYKVGDGVWTAISSSNSETYTAGNLTESTSFRRVATNTTCGETVYSNEITVAVFDEMNAGVIADDQSVCYGGDPNAFTATSATGGNGTTTYSWESKLSSGSVWTEVATSELYDVPAGITVNTDYRRTSTNVCGSAISNIIRITVHPEMDAGAISYTGGDICFDSDPDVITNVTNATGGFGSWTYQWEYQSNCSGAWVEIDGATGTSYDPPANQTETRCYRRIGINATCGTIETASVTITVMPDINGGTIGGDQSVCYGDDPTAFTNVAVASGGIGAFTYFWQSKTTGEWTNIAGATSQTYTAPGNITTTTEYRRGATNTCGTVYSNTVTITVADDVLGGEISQQEAICYNTAAINITNITDPTGGTGAWTYEWEKKTTGAWVVIASSNTQDYNPGTLIETTSYRRKSTNSCGSAYSNVVTVEVYDEFIQGTIAGNQTICYNGDPAEITQVVPPTGGNITTPIAYKWEYQSNCTGAWVEIDGATSSSYNPPAGLAERRCYRRVEIDECGTNYSNTITIDVGVPLIPGTIDGNQTICLGDDAAILNNVAVATGDGTLTYFWEKKTTGGFNAIAGATATSYTPAAGSITETTYFRRGVTDNCNTEYSNEITVTVQPLPVVTLADFDDVCIDGSPVTLTGGSPAGGDYSGTSVTSGSFNPVTAGVGTHTITYTYTDGCTGIATNTITVNPLPVVYNVIGGGNYCESNPSLEVELSGSQIGVTYTLYKNGFATPTTVVGNGESISFGTQEEGLYTIEGQENTTHCAQFMTGSATITKVPEISGNTISADQTVCTGSAIATLSGLTPTGGDGTYTYQWMVSSDGTNFSSIGGATLIDYNPGTATASRWYKRKVFSTTCESESNIVHIAVNQPIANNSITQAQTICYNSVPDEIDGSIPTNGNGVYTYQWQSSTDGTTFVDIIGAEDVNYQPGALTENTWFRRLVSSAPCDDNTSNAIKITVNAEFSVQNIATINPTCNGVSNGTATVTLIGGELPFTYSWNTTPEQTGSTANNLSAGVVYTVTVTDAIGCEATGNITLTEPTAITIDGIVPTDVAGCHGDAAGRIEALASGGTPNYTYTLKKDGTIMNVQSPIHPLSAEFDNLIAGTYTIVVTDANGCAPVTSDDIVIGEPDALIINNVETTPISCNGSADGTITITAAGGTEPFVYSIDGGFTFQPSNVFIVGEGYYDVLVKDVRDCEVAWDVQVEMIEPTPILFSYEISPITTCNGDNAGAITISNVSGGSGDGYQYSISMPEVWGDNPVFVNLPGGSENNYYIKVRDSHGCISVANNGNHININQPDVINFELTIVNVTGCWYNENGKIMVKSVIGGTGAKRYSIDGVNYTTNSTFNVGVGTYTVFVKDGHECIATKVASVTGPEPIEINSITVTDVTCFGNSDGRVDFSASGGTGNLEYSLDGVTYQSDNQFFIGLGAGDKTLYIRDENGCILIEEFTVAHPEVLYFRNAQATDITCHGLVDGTITLTGAGGNGSTLEYSINGGITYVNNGGIFTGLPAGTYTPAVTDGTCAILGEDLTVVEPEEIAILTEASTDIVCHDANDGTITITANGGTGVLSYGLYLGATLVETRTDGQFSNLAEGTYTVSVTDENSCGPVISSALTVTNPTAVEFTYTTTDLTCFGYDDGTITIAPTGGDGTYEYSINGSDFATIPVIIDNLPGGVYTVIVRDGLLCESAPQDITVVEPDGMGLMPVVSQITCFGENDGEITTTASGGSGVYQFRIDGGEWQNSGVFQNLVAGIHTVAVFDGSCILDSVVTIIEPAVIQINSIESTNILCGGDSNGTITVDAQGGTGDLTYNLFDGTGAVIATNIIGSFTGLDGGTYSVTVGDENNCPVATSASIIIDEPNPVAFTFTKTDIACNGEGDGSITILGTGGSGVYEYSIDASDYVAMTGGSSETINNLSAGTYSIIIRDGNGCLSEAQNITILESASLIIALTPNDISCNGEGDGSISVAVTGGTPPYEYRIDGGAWQPSNIFDITIGGTYFVEVQDALGCSEGDIATVNEPTVITITDIIDINPTCQMLGSIIAIAEGGVEPLTYTITPSNESNTNGVFENLEGGTYTIEVVDARGCGPISETVVLVAPSTISITDIATTNITPCSGDTNGQIVITATGGTAPLMFSIDGGTTYQASNIFDNVPAGTYAVVVNDVNDCPQSAVATITEPSPILLETPIVTQESGFNTNDGSIILLASGGVDPLEYTLQPTGTANNSGVFENLGTGVYRIDVTDANGCTVSTGDITISGMDIQVTHTDVTCYGMANGSIDARILGGFPPYTVSCISVVTGNAILLNAVDSTNGTYFHVSGLSPDTLLVTFTNSLNQSFPSRQIEITQPDTMVVSLTSASNPLCSGENNGTVIFNIAGGTPDYTVSWGDSSTVSNTITGLSEGAYSFIITDANGCASDTIETILVSPDSIEVAVQVVQETGYGANNGIVQVEATGGTGSYTYILQPLGVTSDLPIFNNVGPGTYFVQVLDQNACTAQSNEFDISGTDIVIDTIVNVTCNAEPSGMVGFTINHGFFPFVVDFISDIDTIRLIPSDTTGRHFEVDSLLAGNYTIGIIDSLGNNINGYVDILQPDSIMASILAITIPECYGDSTATVEFNISGGTPSYTITWGEGNTIGSTIDSIAAGHYSFSITDANSCRAVVIDTVIGQPLPIIIADTTLIDPVCYGQAIGSIELSATGGTGSLTYQLMDNEPIVDGYFTGLMAGTYQILVLDTLGCSSTFNLTLRDTSRIEIEANTFAETMDCSYDTEGFISLNVTGGYGNYQYIWPSLDQSTDSVSGLTPGEYVVLVVDAANCMVSDTFTISGPDKFIFNESVISEASCRHSNFDFDGTMSVGGNGGNSGLITYSLINAENDTISAGAPNFTNLAAGAYVIIAEDSHGCQYQKLDTIPINPLYNFTVDVPDTVVCFANNVTLTGHMVYDTLFNSSLNVIYEWWKSDNHTNEPDNIGENYNMYLPESKTYRFKLRVSLSDNPKCYEEDWAEVNVYPAIDVHVPIYVSSVQNDTIVSVLLDNEYNIDVNTKNVDYATDFRWYPSEMFTDTASWNTSILITKEKYNELNALYPNRFVELKDPQTNKLTQFILADVVATTEVGCVDSLRLYTKIVNKLYLASVFSPNGDGRNDVWQIPKDYLFPDVEVEIFNRWGSLVWSAKGDKASRGWDGRTNGGKALPIGTYWYVIKFNLTQGDLWKPITGSVTIVK